MYKAATLLLGQDVHHVDHTAPLASILSLPLGITNSDLEKMIETYYPTLSVEVHSELNFSDALLSSYDLLFTCLPKPLFEPLFFFDEQVRRKKMLSCWIPHGNSDKENLSALVGEKLLLAYGRQMSDIFKREGVTDKAYKIIEMGNYRAHYYRLHKKYYDTLLKDRLSFRNQNPTILYAPTWNDSAIAHDLPRLLKALPSSYNLYIKLHPNLRNSPHLTRFLEDKVNVKCIDDIPTVFPILERSNFLITDMSSIAYDFLSFDRPLFFFTTQKKAIQFTGTISTPESLFEDLEKEDIHKGARHELYSYAFKQNINYLSLAEEIEKCCRAYIDEELHLF